MSEPLDILREKVLAQYIDVTHADAPEGSQFLEGRWYAPKWGVDTLEHVLDAILSLLAEAQRESWLAALDWRETRLGFVNGMSVRQREAAEAEASRRFPIPGDKA